MFNFDTTYSRLPVAMFSWVRPVGVRAPGVVVLNEGLAGELGVTFGDEGMVAQVLGGNVLVGGSESIAQAYAGHQFGHFAILGDGRAVLLGEHVCPDGRRVDVQLKGSGQTPYSRRGDGRASLGPMLREYVMSEAMYALGIPTTRSLAVVSTGESVMRERVMAGAVLTRVAESHLRVGTFEYVALTGDVPLLHTMVEYALSRHYPQLVGAENPALALLEAVRDRQISLVTHWMRVGFVHGVMNTDNVSIAGETIDYGPCAFMDWFDPSTVFSSIDHAGRYAYGNQPAITHWNLYRLAAALLPAIHPHSETAIDLVEGVLSDFDGRYRQSFLAMNRGKLGLGNSEPLDERLIADLFQWMYEAKADYTTTFRVLNAPSARFSKGSTTPASLRSRLLGSLHPSINRTDGAFGNSPLISCLSGAEGDLEVYLDPAFLSWVDRWESRRARQEGADEASFALMRASNPVVIPRNDRVAEALRAMESGEDRLFHRLLEAVRHPYEDRPEFKEYHSPPPTDLPRAITFCGT